MNLQAGSLTDPGWWIEWGNIAGREKRGGTHANNGDSLDASWLIVSGKIISVKFLKKVDVLMGK
jgi:hypothetical protein